MNYIHIDIPSNSYNNIREMLLIEISIPSEKLKPFSSDSNDIDKYLTGFRFNDEPPIGIGTYTKRYCVKYGVLIPFISYAFWWNYKKRKIYTKFAKKEGLKNSVYVDSFLKKIEFKKITGFIVQGTIVSEITLKEYFELSNLYNDKVKEYDLYQLNTRLKIK